MPEGDTVWRTAQRLHAALAGHEVTRWDLRWGDMATTDLTGARTIEVVPRGKHLLQRLDSGHTLHSHLRMEGQWRIAHTGPEADRTARGHPVRAVVGAAGWTAIGLRLGMLDLLPTDRESEVVGHLGPDLLGPDWDLDAAVAAVVADPRPIAEALLDQRVVAGIGTIWASEPLFAAGIHPLTPANSLAPASVGALLERTRRRMMASATASTHPGRDEKRVHGRSGRPCTRCGAAVEVTQVGESTRKRPISFCPVCQRLPA